MINIEDNPQKQIRIIDWWSELSWEDRLRLYNYYQSNRVNFHVKKG
jgi:hypothetical protein